MAKQTSDETNICIYFGTISNNYVGRLVCSVFVVNMTFEKSIFSKRTRGKKLQPPPAHTHCNYTRAQIENKQYNKLIIQSISFDLTLNLNHFLQSQNPLQNSLENKLFED